MIFTFTFYKYFFHFARNFRTGHFHGTRGACAVSTVALRLDSGTFKITEKRLAVIVIFLFFFTALYLGKVMVDSKHDLGMCSN